MPKDLKEERLCVSTFGRLTLITDDRGLFPRSIFDDGTVDTFIASWRDWREALLGHDWFVKEIQAGRLPEWAQIGWSQVKPWEVQHVQGIRGAKRAPRGSVSPS